MSRDTMSIDRQSETNYYLYVSHPKPLPSCGAVISFGLLLVPMVDHRDNGTSK